LKKKKNEFQNWNNFFKKHNFNKKIDPPTYLRNGTLTSLYHFSNYDNLVLLFSITICIFISSTIYLSFFSGRIEVNWGIIWIGIGLFHAL